MPPAGHPASPNSLLDRKSTSLRISFYFPSRHSVQNELPPLPPLSRVYVNVDLASVSAPTQRDMLA